MLYIALYSYRYLFEEMIRVASRPIKCQLVATFDAQHKMRL